MKVSKPNNHKFPVRDKYFNYSNSTFFVMDFPLFIIKVAVKINAQAIGKKFIFYEPTSVKMAEVGPVIATFEETG